MLHVASEFPEAGSYTLLDRCGRTQLVRIQYRVHRFGQVNAVLSVPRTFHASGTLTVPLAELRDPRPLSAEERAERDRLARLKRPKLADRARLVALRTREIDARLVEEALRAAGLHLQAAA